MLVPALVSILILIPTAALVSALVSAVTCRR
jgi:hypothetical protein